MINYDYIFNLSRGVTCNWCIQLDALESIALMHGNIHSIDQRNPEKACVGVIVNFYG